MTPESFARAVASTRSASAVVSSPLPTATILPSRISTSASSSRWPLPMSTVACCSSTGGPMIRL